MSATVDNRVVDMGFNNQQFEKGVKQSTESLDKLKKSLDLSESAKGFDSMDKAAKKVSLTHISDGVQNVSSKFSALGVIGFTVLQNLTNAAINYGKTLVRNMMDPVKQGFQEYETQMNAIQTVLANTESKGTTLKDVTAALDELNTYADKTIYNFTEMTRNIGTFTAAGVELDTSVAAIKGIANLAAVSGSNSQQASTAMYQLSQALSSGTVKLQDWNSVVNAGMGGQVFQDALKETARVHGIAIDDMIDQEGSFRETLSQGWLTSEVLLETLSKFTGDLSAQQLEAMGYTEQQIKEIQKLGQTANDAATKVKTFTQLKDTLQEAIQSGWTKSWEIVLGDFEEAKELFTWLSDSFGALIGESADARNKILSDWKKFGGRKAAVEAVKNTFEGLLSILAPIKEAFADVFSSKNLRGWELANLTRTIRDFTEKLKISGETADKIKRIFTGVFSIFDIARMFVVDLVTALFGLGKSIPLTGEGILEFLANIGDWIAGLRDAIKVNQTFKKFFEDIKAIIVIAGAAIAAFVKTVKDKFKEWNISVDSIKGKFTEFITFIQGKIEILRGKFTTMFSGDMFSGVKEFVDKAREMFAGLFDEKGEVSPEKGNALFEKFSEKMAKVGEQIDKVVAEFKKLRDKASPIIDTIKENIGGFFESLKEYFKIDFSDVLDTVFKGLNAGIFAGILLAIRKFLKSGGNAVESFGSIFEGLNGVLGSATGILDGVRGSLEAWQSNLKAKTLLTIAGAVALLTASLVVLTFIDSGKLAVSLGIITGLFANLMGSMALYSKVGGGGAKSSIGLIAISAAVLVMAGAMKVISSIDEAAMERGLKAIFALLAGILTFSVISNKSGGVVMKGAGGLASFAFGLLVMTQAVAGIGKLDPEVMTQGLIGVGAMLAEIALFLKIADLDGMGSVKGVGIAVLAGALMVMSLAVRQFGEMDPEKMKQGLIAMGAVLAEIGIFTKLTGDGKSMIGTSVAMVIMAGAMAILSKVLEKLGDMDMEEIGKGLLAMAGMMAILAVALYAMSGTLAGSAAVLVAAIALAALTPILMALGNMSLMQIGTGLLALAGVFLVLGVAGYALAPVVPALLGLGAALLLISAGAALVGLGLLAFSAGLAALAISGMAGATAIVGMVTVILALVPIIIGILIESLIIFGKGIIRATPIIMKAITELMLGFLQVIIDITPKIMETLEVLLKALIQLIRDMIPDFISAVLELMLTLLEEIAAKMPDFIQAGFDILISFLQGIRDNIAEVVTVVVEIVTEFLGAVAENLPDIIQSGWDLMIAFIDGMADGIDNNMQPALDAVGRLAKAIVDGFTAGLTKWGGAIITKLVQLATDAFEAAKTALGINSPSKKFMEIGRSIPEGMVKGVKVIAHHVPRAVTKLADSTVNAMSKAIDAVTTGIDGNMDLTPRITPVVDMSEIVATGDYLDDILNNRSLDLAIAASNASKSSGVLVDANGRPVEGDTKIEFTQNNYSPKALSRVDIYRQTRNQLRGAKGLLSS